jgi:hypothetical protein
MNDTRPSAKPKAPDMFREYLNRNPERGFAALLPRSAVALARGGFLLHGIFVRGWSVGWLAGFLFAEFFLVVRLATLGDRWGGGPSLDEGGRARRSPFGEVMWALLSIAVFYVVGGKLDAETGALGMGLTESVRLNSLSDLVVRPAWGVLAYLASFLVEFAIELFHARAGRQAYVSASALTATFFLLAVILAVFLIPFAGVVGGMFGLADRFLVHLAAVILVFARSGADLAVLWFPYWGHRLADWTPPPRRSRAVEE